MYMSTSASVCVLAGQKASQLTSCSLFYHSPGFNLVYIFPAFLPPRCTAGYLTPFSALAMETTSLRLEGVKW